MTSTERPTARTASNTHGTLTEQMSYARNLAGSDMLPDQYRNKSENVLWAIAYAEMLGMHPMAVITGMHNMQGKPTASSAFIGMLVRRAGHRLDVYMDQDGKTAVAELTRADAPDRTFRTEWTYARAENAKLTGKGTWRQFPQAMLKARAATEIARDNAPDALFGILYTPEELGADNTDEDGMVTTASAPSDAAPAEPAATSEAEDTARQAREGLEGSTSGEKIETAVDPFAESPDRVEFVEKMRAKLEEAGGDTAKLRKLREFVVARIGEHRFVTNELDPAIAAAEEPEQQATEVDSAEEFDWEGAIEDAEREGDQESIQIYVDTLEGKRGANDRTARIARAALKRVADQQQSMI